MKFGLPRVLPPSRIRDGSSGYNSSEEGRRVSQSVGPQSGSGIRSARSDPDFRQVHSTPREHHHHATHSQLIVNNNNNRDNNSRLRGASSEANLLHSLKQNRRHSIAPIDPGYGHTTSVLSHSQSHGHIGPGDTSVYMTGPMRRVTHQHPYLQLRNIETRDSVLRNISLEAGATDLLAVMSTTENEGMGIIETISGRRRIKRGDILLNGRTVSISTLKSRVAYLPAESSLSHGLTAQQVLSFYVCLRGGSRTSEIETEVILQELGLETTKHCLVDSLTTSEARRLALACRLLQDSHILTLDRPTHGLDIFDAFFLVEYLRQWATRGQRLVVLTLHPPTYEILTMVSRVALTSSGRIMYTGHRRDMLPYFSLAEFPCPPFKNPSDYYRKFKFFLN